LRVLTGEKAARLQGAANPVERGVPAACPGEHRMKYEPGYRIFYDTVDIPGVTAGRGIVFLLYHPGKTEKILKHHPHTRPRISA